MAIPRPGCRRDRKSTRLNSSHDQISYAVFCLKKKKDRQLARGPRDRADERVLGCRINRSADPGGAHTGRDVIGRCRPFFFFNDTATTEIYTLSLHDALPI